MQIGCQRQACSFVFHISISLVSWNSQHVDWHGPTSRLDIKCLEAARTSSGKLFHYLLVTSIRTTPLSKLGLFTVAQALERLGSCLEPLARPPLEPACEASALNPVQEWIVRLTI
jgi:hypothetical protein